MSARDVIADTLENTPEGQSEWGHIGRAAQILDALHAMPDADRIALARVLVPDGWIVEKVPERTVPETVPWRYGDQWDGIQDWYSEEHLDQICNGYADGWNACRAAMLASGEEAT